MRPSSWLPVFASVWFLNSCGGEGGSGGSLPSAISYPVPPAFVVGQAIAPLTPTVTGNATSYSVSPALPAGLAVTTVSGVIYGTPTVVAARATYTVTASNSYGATTTGVSIAVNDIPPSVSYASGSVSYTNGVPAQVISPSATGGAVVSWAVSPSLPAGLALGSTDGSISGTPTAAAAAARYMITATNSGGQSTASLTVAVSPGPAFDVGHGNGIASVRRGSTRILSQDYFGHWVLWDIASRMMIASGTVPTAPHQRPPPVDLAGPNLVIGTPMGFEVRSSTTGQLLATVTTALSWWSLATDGSYVCGGSPTSLTVWSPSGQVLAMKSGDYSQASAYAAPGTILVAMGAAGASAIETIALPGGVSTVGSAFRGSFNPGSETALGSSLLTGPLTSGGSTRAQQSFRIPNRPCQTASIARRRLDGDTATGSESPARRWTSTRSDRAHYRPRAIRWAPSRFNRGRPSASVAQPGSA